MIFEGVEAIIAVTNLVGKGGPRINRHALAAGHAVAQPRAVVTAQAIITVGFRLERETADATMRIETVQLARQPVSGGIVGMAPVVIKPLPL